MKLTSLFNKELTREVPDAQRAAAPDAVTPAVTPPVAPAAPDLSFIPGDFVVDGKPDVGKFSDHYTGMVAADAQRREREAAVPEKYDFALPADMKFEGMDLPEDFSVNVAEGFEPLFGELGGVLKELGAPAEAAGKLTGLLARYEAQKASTEFANWKTDMATLGTPEQQSARAKNVQRALQTKLPAAEAEALFSGPRISAAGIRALEKLLSGTNLSTPTTPPPNAADEALTPMERLKRANMKK